MNIADFLHQQGDKRGFSFEVLPPLKGNGTAALFRTIDALSEFGPRFINITTHHSEYVYKELENGLLTRQRVRRRPGTVAIAGAIQNKYDIPVIPHIICSGATKEDIEYELLDLQSFCATQTTRPDSWSTKSCWSGFWSAAPPAAHCWWWMNVSATFWRTATATA